MKNEDAKLEGLRSQRLCQPATDYSDKTRLIGADWSFLLWKVRIYMSMQYYSFEDLKRKIYLWILPFILVNVSFIHHDHTLSLRVNVLLVCLFLLSWLFIFYKKRIFRFLELANLALVSVATLVTMLGAIRDMNVGKIGTLGDFIIWCPLLIIYIFFTLSRKKALIFSISILSIIYFKMVLDWNGLSIRAFHAVSQFVLANLVYIVILYFAQTVFSAYAEVEIMKENAFKDFLTGVANRHQIDVWLDEQFEKALKKGNKLALIFFDIDHFKEINDQYGHRIGDSVLKELADLVKSNLQDDELFGRWGGEEFIIIPKYFEQDPLEISQKLVELIHRHSFENVGNVTVSVGVSYYHVGDSIDSLLNRADEALYLAKRGGRNQVREL